ncbi:LGFP repeat-containing protein [Sinomonas atrocyanea]
MSGGVYQRYQGGAVYWSPSTGAHAVTGAFTAAMAGGGFSAVGFPTAEKVVGLVRGGAYQSFQKGLLVSSPATGAHVSSGALRAAWGSTDYERGPLGYPISDPYAGPAVLCSRTTSTEGSSSRPAAR